MPALGTNTGGWAIIDDDFLGQNGVETDTWLVSPVIDLSAAPPFLKLEFEQYFQEFQNDTTFVGVTVNAGPDWNWIALNDDVGGDGRPNPELMDVNISDWVALGPSTVQIAFRYLATWDYGWQVDNVRITDLEDNDVALLNAHFTGFDFTNTGFSDIEYSIYPQEQVRPMLLHADVKNKGYAQQTGINFNVEVVGPGGSEYTGTEVVGDQVPGQTDSVANEGLDAFDVAERGALELPEIVAGTREFLRCCGLSPASFCFSFFASLRHCSACTPCPVRAGCDCPGCFLVLFKGLRRCLDRPGSIPRGVGPLRVPRAGAGRYRAALNIYSVV